MSSRLALDPALVLDLGVADLEKWQTNWPLFKRLRPIYRMKLSSPQNEDVGVPKVSSPRI